MLVWSSLNAPVELSTRYTTPEYHADTAVGIGSTSATVEKVKMRDTHARCVRLGRYEVILELMSCRQGWGVTKYKYFVTILRYFFEYFVM